MAFGSFFKKSGITFFYIFNLVSIYLSLLKIVYQYSSKLKSKSEGNQKIEWEDSKD